MLGGAVGPLDNDYLEACAKHMTGSKENDNFGTRLKLVLYPLLEEEVERRVQIGRAEKATNLQSELDSVREKYRQLSQKYDILTEEMQRSRQLFEKKCQEWDVIKETLSKKERLKSLLATLESSNSGTEAASSEQRGSSIGNVNSKSEMLDLSERDFREVLSAVEADSRSDPLGLLLDGLGASLTQGSILPLDETVASETFPQVQGSPGVTAKRPGAPYAEPMRNRVERRNAHAKDCPCCTKVSNYCRIIHPLVL
jgi:hypothetical protein